VEVNIKTVQIVNASDDFASLDEATATSYTYRFNFAVNKTAATNAYAAQIVLRAYADDPKNAVPLSLFANQKSQTLNILNQNTKQLISNIQQRASRITTAIANTRTNSLAERKYSLPDLIQRFNHGVGYTVVTDNPKDAVKNQVFNASKNIAQQALNEDKTITQLSEQLLYMHKTDPADAIKRIYASSTAYETNNGLNAFSSNSDRDDIEHIKTTIAASLLTTNNIDEVTKPILQTYSIAERQVITIHPEFVFPAEKIGTTNFYLMVSVIDLSGNLVQEFVKLVSHRTNITRLQKIIVAPDFAVSKLSDGTLNFALKQQDPNGTGVRIYRSVYNTSATADIPVQEVIGNFDLSAGQSRVFNIQNDELGLLLFRALSYNEAGEVGSTFSSAVIDTTPMNSHLNEFLGIHYEYTREGLKITLSELQNDIAFIELYRTNLTIDPYTETLLTTFNVGGSGANATYVYLETSLDASKAYRYRCSVIDMSGNRFDSSGMIEFVYEPQVLDYAVATFTAPTITPTQPLGASTQYYDVSFDVSYAITDKLEDNVKKLLINQGLIAYYGADINRDRLKDLLVTKVELRDLETNNKYFMGYIDTTYVQNTTRFGLLTRSSKYLYELTTYVRNPATLLQAVQKTGLSTPRTNSKRTAPTYTYVPYNVNNPVGLKTGTNPKTSGDEFVTAYGLDQLEFGAITGIDYITVDLKPPSPTVNNLNASVFNSKSIDLKWSVNGDQSHISHFIIRRQNIGTGKVDLIGKAHGINVQNNYTFVDMIRSTDTGVFRYVITIQYFNSDLGPDYASNEVVI
jgi:hypothetical protein